MKRLIVPAILALAVAAPAAAEVRNLSGFTNVHASAGTDVNVTIGPAFRVEVTGAGADRIQTTVQGDTLHVRPTPGFRWGRRPPSEVRVTMPRVTGLSASSGADLEATGLNGGDVSLSSSSGADLEVSGACDAVTASASSGADIDARRLVCASGSASVSSGADIVVHVTGALDINASSGGDIAVYGDPRIGDVSLSSGGSFRRAR